MSTNTYIYSISQFVAYTINERMHTFTCAHILWWTTVCPKNLLSVAACSASLDS